MRYEQDWLMRQINMIVNVVARALLNKTEETEQIMETDLTGFTRRLDEMLLGNNINEAENFLYNNINRNSYQYLKIGLDFYDRINKLDDKTLEEANFSRKEIEQGLKEFVGIYGFDYLNIDFNDI